MTTIVQATCSASKGKFHSRAQCFFVRSIVFGALEERSHRLCLSSPSERYDYEEVPGCVGGENFRRVDFCAHRPTENTLWSKGNNGRPKKYFPLGLCDGDCDTDAECQPGLIW